MTGKANSKPAAHVVAAFRYQILQSVLALLALDHVGDELLLEVEEDYSVRSGGVQTDVQVKNSQALAGPPSWSLQSEPVRHAIVRLWHADRDLPGPKRRLVFLARGGRAVERDHVMPGGVSGIEYWQAAAIGADIAPLRPLLAAVFEGTEIGEWLQRDPTDAELRDRLLRRVTFELEQLASEAVFTAVQDKLRVLYGRMNLPVTVADLAIGGLIDLVFERASRPLAGERKLGRSDLEALLQDFAGKALVVERMSGLPTLPDDLLVFPVEGIQKGASRTDTVSDLAQRYAGQPLLWIHGAHGTGKSTLARLLADRFRGKWLVLDLWTVKDEPLAALSAWRDLLGRISVDGIAGIIVDNVVGSAGDVLVNRLLGFSRTFASNGGRVIVTSHQQPLPGWLSEAGAKEEPIAAPYLSDEDILEMINREPPPDNHRAWSLMIGLASAGGHPTLVATKIASLRARGWPASALLEDMGPPSEVIQITRDAARRKLIQNLQELDGTRSFEAGQLLRRIASVFDRVDEKLALRLAAMEPPLRSASDALAMLKGTWLEVLPKGDLRVSPLIADINRDVSPDDTNMWRQSAAIYWISKKTLDERTLPLCFWNAYLGEQNWVLVKLAETLQTMGRAKFISAAPMLSPITALNTDGPIYVGDTTVSAMLRVLQFAVATALDQHDVARKAADRLLVELDGLQELPRALITCTGALQILLSDAELRVAQRLEYAARLRVAYPAVRRLTGEDLEDPAKYLPPQLRSDMDSSDFLITRVVGKIHTGADFLEVIEAFDAISGADRNRLLDTIDLMYGGLSVFASTGWAGDQIAKRAIDATYQTYLAAEEIVAKWERRDLEIEMSVSKSVILDECMGNIAEALRSILSAIEVHGTHPALVRQHARVLAHSGRHAEALDLTLTIEDSISQRDGLEHVLAARDGAVSAGKAGLFSEAIRLFTKARDGLSDTEDRWPIRTGMLIEIGLVQWRNGSYSDAITTAAQVLQELEHFTPESSRQAERAHQYGRALVGLFHQEPMRAPHHENPPFGFGQASQLELTNADLMGVPIASLPDNWMVLAAVEADLGEELGIAELARARQPDRLHLSLEANLRIARYTTATSRGDVATAIAEFANVRHITDVARPAADEHKRVDATHFISNLSDFYVASNVESMAFLVLDLASYQVIEGSYSQAFMRRIASRFERTFGDSRLISPLLDAASQLYPVGSSSREAFLLHGLTKHASKVAEDPAIRLMRDITLINHARYSLVRSELLAGATKLVVAGWRIVAESGSGTLQSELAAVFAQNLSMPRTAAAVLAAAGQHVRHSFADAWFDLAWLDEVTV